MAKKKTEKVVSEPINLDGAVDDLQIQALITAQFTKEYGEGSIMALSDDTVSSVTEWVPTGSYLLNDWISGGRGLPVGKIVTINGKKSSGKSTIAASVIAEAQKMGALTVYFDTEYAFDKVRAATIGINCNKLLLAQPDYLEQVFIQIEALIEISRKTNRLMVIVWDSIAATPTKKEVEGEFGEGGHYGEHSKILSQGYRKIAKPIAESRVLLFQVNQIKTNINAGLYQSDVTYIGKNPIDFHSHIMIEVVEGAKIKESETSIIGIESNIRVSKSRVAAPFKSGHLHILFASGIDKAWEALEIGKKYQRARLDGSWNCILKQCPGCAGVGCESCKKYGVVQDETYKKFYTSQINDLLEESPGLEQYLVHGTPIELAS